MARSVDDRPRTGGLPVRAKGAAVKAAGGFTFLTDRQVEGCLWATAIRSGHPRAEVHGINREQLLAAEGVAAVYTWADTPATRYNTALIPPDEGAGAPPDKRMLTASPRHVGDEVAVVVAGSRAQARRAARLARVTCSPAEPVLTLDEAISRRVVGRLASGSPRATGLVASADLTVQHRVEFAAAQHTCLETPACVAIPDPAGRSLEIWTNTQCPAEVRRTVAQVLSLDGSAVRIRKVDEGGGFGAKQDVYAEPLAGWLALRLRRPVRFGHTRAEELTAGRVRAAGRIDLALGFSRSGMLLASEMTAVLDSGAYLSHTPAVLSCLPGHLTAAYPRAVHHFDGMLVATDTIPAGAYRGYGVADANLAVEQAMDLAAARLGLTPVDIRLRNVVGGPDGAAAACLRAAAATPVRGATGDGDVRRGRGVAVAVKHSVTSGAPLDRSTAEVALWPGPVLLLTTGTCDSGTGSSRALARIVATELGAPLDRVLVREGDTDQISDLGSTAQRSVFVGGESARQAARLLRAELVRRAGNGRGGLTLRWPFLVDGAARPAADLAELAEVWPAGSVAARATAAAPGGGASYCALAVEVAVDVRTGAVRVEQADAVVDCGQVVDAAGATGQVAGGIVQGIGLACTDGWLPGPAGRGPGGIAEHGVPRAPDAPALSVTFHQGRGRTGPSGLGELPIVPVAAAVANAVADATGIRPRRTPLDAAELWQRMAAWPRSTP
jgi:xanthine dehydrogenase molybdenum-binding subunit